MACWHAQVVLTGHSLGGALAQIAAADLSAFADTADAEYTLLTCAAPRAGNLRFARGVAAKVEGRAYRVVNDVDIVPALGPAALNFAHVPGRTLLLRKGGAGAWVPGYEYPWGWGELTRRLCGALRLRLGAIDHIPWKYLFIVRQYAPVPGSACL